MQAFPHLVVVIVKVEARSAEVQVISLVNITYAVSQNRMYARRKRRFMQGSGFVEIEVPLDFLGIKLVLKSVDPLQHIGLLQKT